MIDIAAVRQAYERREVTIIVWIKGTSNPADAMTKSTGRNQALSEIISTNKYILDKKAWVNRVNIDEVNIEKKEIIKIKIKDCQCWFIVIDLSSAGFHCVDIS